MASIADKPHAVCYPWPAQGHINPMLQLAKLLHYRGFHITFVNTEENHKRLLESRVPNTVLGLPDFRFETIIDGLPPNVPRYGPCLCEHMSKNCLTPFRNLLAKLNDDALRSNVIPPVTCVISDGNMTFTVEASKEVGVPHVLFWTTSACGFLAYTQFGNLINRGLTPFKDEDYESSGYLDTAIDWIPGMKDIRLRDLPSFIRTTDPNDTMLNFAQREADGASKGSAVILNTFDALEQDGMDALSSMFSRIYSIGPLQLLLNQILQTNLESIGSINLWKEELQCLQWLDSKEPNSVVYLNFGSHAVMKPQQLIEFGWGLANSKKTFLWVVRPDLVAGSTAILPPEFMEETEERCLMVKWCPQEQVLGHPSVGGFLTHSGWNSTIESIYNGVPMVCWPVFAEQQTNCRYACTEWGVGMEIDNNVKRDEVEKLVRELMEGEKGKALKNKAVDWKKKAEEATSPIGSSYKNLDQLVKEVLLSKG